MRKVSSNKKTNKKNKYTEYEEYEDDTRSGMGKGCLIFVTILFIIIIAVVSYIVFNVINRTQEGKDPFQAITETFIPAPPERTTFLVVGVDREETLTDTIMLMCFNSVTNSLDIISVPRDSMVEIDGKTMKINAVNGWYGGGKDGINGLKTLLEDMFDINIDYYAKVSCEAFEKIVDGIGGIDYDVPMRMYYNDPAQDLYIDLYPGLQHLNGEQAEGLVRFRKGYDRQDLDRVEVQRDFIKVFLQTALSTENIIKNPTAYVKTFFEDVETDFSVISDFPTYASTFLNFSAENVTGYTLEGESQYINGISYFVLDTSANRKIMYEIFKKESLEIVGEAEEYNSRECSIKILNGSSVNGLAGRTQEILENDGYNVEEIGNFDGENLDDTLIYVNDTKYGYDLKQYFKNAEIIQDENITAFYDIVIVVGTNDENIS